ncbi:DUF2127 domain-containing protein [Nitrospira sp. Nam74]
MPIALVRDHPLVAGVGMLHPQGNPSLYILYPMGLQLIILWNLIRAVLLIVLGSDLLRHLDADPALLMTQSIETFRLDPHNRYVHGMLEQLNWVDRRRLEALSVGTFFYAALLLLEGGGLWFKQRWAAYLSVVATSVFIPLELFELTRGVTIPRVMVMLSNLAIVAYLLLRVVYGDKKGGIA